MKIFVAGATGVIGRRVVPSLVRAGHAVTAVSRGRKKSVALEREQMVWPAMRFDRPLQIGAVGGHGPIQYRVDAYEPGRRVRFALRAPDGFHGFHGLEVISAGAQGTTLRHVLEMNAQGRAMLTWPAVFRPLHDALVEDCLDNAAFALGEATRSRPWSLWIRILRAAFRRWGRRHARAGAV